MTKTKMKAFIKVFILIILLFDSLSCKRLRRCGPCSCKNGMREVTCTGDRIFRVPTRLTNSTTSTYITTKLTLSGTGIKVIRAGDFKKYPNLINLFIQDSLRKPCLLQSIHTGAFDNLNHLDSISIVGCLRLRTIEKGVLGTFQKLGTLQIYRSGLVQVPDLSNFKTNNPKMDQTMHDIDFSSNRIQKIDMHAFMNVKTFKLRLERNRIQEVQNNAFYYANVNILKLNNNPLDTIGEEAFVEINGIESLDLSYTAITSLPTSGLKELKQLYLRETKTLRQFPSILFFENLEIARLYYPHHCCAFRIPEKQNPAKWRAYEEAQKRINADCDTLSPVNSTFSLSYILPPFDSKFGNTHSSKRQKRNWLDGPIDSNIQHNSTVACGNIHRADFSDIDCTPAPDALNPCEDVMGYKWLRVFVWIVVLAAILGNVIVFVVLVFSRKKMTVPKFLMCNLAFADFLMGIYLLMLASIDAHTTGEYFNYAILWQNEGGCQIAGFLTVFSSELSIFTLTVITLERWYAISHAIHLTKRLKLRQAVFIMTGGWVYATVMAHLPLIGISGYGNVSICLPMKVGNATDLAYVISLLVINGVAFLCISCCYVNMYWQVRQSDSTARSNDATIAKRMAMLVFTNFICWAPIAFFGLTASSGFPLIDITHSKILLVFFYPLNSCANPFLYVIITKQFRKDMVDLVGKYGICKERTNKYKVTMSSKSITQSRKDSLALHNVIHPINSTTTQLSCSINGSKNSLKNGIETPSITPKCTPKENHVSKIENSVIEEKDGTGEGPLGIVKEASVVRFVDDIRTPPPYIRSASEYVIFFPASRKNSSVPKYRHQFSCETYSSGQSSNLTDITHISESTSQEVPWEHSDESNQVQSDDIEENISSVLENITESSPLHPESNDNEKNDDNDYDETDYNDNEDDCVQQTLLKHSTLRDSPGQTKKNRIYKDNKNLKKS